jgi:hypothetical protein
MSSPDPCGAILQPAILSTLNAEPAKRAEKKELNHEGTEDTKGTKVERPAAGGASRHADENGRRNTKQIGENVCVAPAVSVRGARLRARSRVFLCVLRGLRD